MKCIINWFGNTIKLFKSPEDQSFELQKQNYQSQKLMKCCKFQLSKDKICTQKKSYKWNSALTRTWRKETHNPKYPTQNPNLGPTHQRINTQNPPHLPKTQKIQTQIKYLWPERLKVKTKDSRPTHYRNQLFPIGELF